MRKGQISYFILMGLILAIAFGFILYLKNQEQKSRSQISNTIEASYEPVRAYVEDCVKISAKESILSNAYQGGYYNYSGNSLNYSFFMLPFYSKGKSKSTPTLKQLEEQLSYSLDYRIPECADNFEVFKEKGFDINFEKPRSKATILENQVLFQVDFPITVRTNGKNTKTFNAFSVTIPSRYKLVYSIADEISSSLSKAPEKICISCLIDYGAQNDLKIFVAGYDKQAIRFTIIDEKVRIGSESLVFNFAHQMGDIIA